jgi:hypothetical protein
MAYREVCKDLKCVKECFMATVRTEKEVKKIKSPFADDFEDYLKHQCAKTTFNGTELESFSWYKKVLGLM